MLGAIITILLVAAAVYAVTQVGGIITLIFIAAVLFLAYKRLSLLAFTATFTVLLAAYTLWGGHSAPAGVWKGFLWLLLVSLWLLNVRPLRKAVITRPFMKAYLKLLPSMSQTEREALEAGTVWWDGELFTGAPKWSKLLSAKPPRLSVEEQQFLDGPCDELCRMLDDWHITHERGDMPPHVWDYLKSKGFFAMIIPKKYGGLEFSAYAHSCVLSKIASRSATASSTVAVPNSLGPAELLNHYGTQEQKDYYLPRLARGDEIPCFALTSPRAGSDAAAIPDTGVVCRGMWQGREIVGLRLNFNKRYITLAPIATVVGLAFRMFDPDKLLGGKTDIGITCALIPRNTPGLTIGRRHFPLNIPFQNGPLQGKDVFVPLDFIIGGTKMAGSGWRMLVEQLSVGRCISLPSNATGGAKAASWSTGAYARIRRQFNMPVGRFEGVESVLARMVGLTYTMDAARSVTAGAIDGGEKPSVPSAMLKYHVTEMGRQVANDAMDVHGGKGICLGPRNYLGRGYEVVPVAITVEGANLLTRSLIIFGQGAVRCHPFVLKEMTAARNPDRAQGVEDFDRALFGHIGFTISNAVRSLIMALTHARFTAVPVEGPTARYYQHIVRFSASFAFAVDVAMLTLGGYLKKKENLSARLGDVLSCMYLASMVLKHHENQGRPEEDLPIVEWACRDLLYRAQEQMHGFLRNFPNRFLAGTLRAFIFTRGRAYSAPGDRLGRTVAKLVTTPTDARERLCQYIYWTLEPTNPLGLLQEALLLAEGAEAIEKRIRVDGVKTGKVTALDLPGQIQQALAVGIVSETEAAALREYDRKCMHLIHVDDFAPHELGTLAQPDEQAASRSVSTSPEAAGAPAADTSAAAQAAPAEPAAQPEAAATAASPAPPARIAETTPTCANCAAAVSGKYCAHCGQKLLSPVHSVWHFVGEAAEDLTHADSRLWRTLLALLLKPGFLTREFLDGRRVSYLPPVRLYLVVSVLFFLLAASSPAPLLLGAQLSDHGPTRLVVTSVDRQSIIRPGESVAQRQARLCGLIQYHGWWSSRLEPALRNSCVQALADNGNTLRERFLHALPRAMFVFLPLLAAVMTLLYWRPRHYYVEQLLLLIHNHAFTFLLVILSWLVQKAVPPSLSMSWVIVLLRFAVQIYIGVYVYRSMRLVYGQGHLRTLAKFAVMSFAYVASALLVVALTAVYSMLAL